MKSSIQKRLALLAVLALAPMIHATASGVESHPFTHNGYSRPYLVYTPNHLAPHSPVVFVLGGVGSTAESNSKELGWTEEADRNGGPGDDADRSTQRRTLAVGLSNSCFFVVVTAPVASAS